MAPFLFGADMDHDPFSQWRTERLQLEALARKILGVSPKAGVREIRKAYRKMALKFHPDRNTGDPDPNATFINISNAYLVLAKGHDAPLMDTGSARAFSAGRAPGEREYFAWWVNKFRW